MNDHYRQQLFLFNFINVFIPICYICFYRRKFYAVYNLLLLFLAQDQIKSVLERFFGPYLTGVKLALNKYIKEWSELLNKRDKKAKVPKMRQIIRE